MKNLKNENTNLNNQTMPHPKMAMNLLSHSDQYNKILSLIDQNKLHHALLLYGNKGIGKATFAYKIAEILLDNNEKSIRLIKSGSHPNLLVIEPEFDSTKNEYKNTITIDKIRDINSFFNHTSFDYKNKVIIIDSVDLLNNNSLNAILKALEEPPKNTFFLIVCNNVNKLLDTIKSRCLLIKFNDLMDETIQNILNMNLIKSLEGQIKYLSGSLANVNWLLNNKNKNIIPDIEELFSTHKTENIMDLKNRWGNIDEYSFNIIINIIKNKLIELYKNTNNPKIFDVLSYIISLENKVFNINLDVYSILLIICLSICDIFNLE